MTREQFEKLNCKPVPAAYQYMGRALGQQVRASYSLVAHAQGLVVLFGGNKSSHVHYKSVDLL